MKKYVATKHWMINPQSDGGIHDRVMLALLDLYAQQMVRKQFERGHLLGVVEGLPKRFEFGRVPNKFGRVRNAENLNLFDNDLPNNQFIL